MANNITLTIVKPGAYRKGYTGPILNMINEAGFRIIAMKLTQLSVRQAEEFYIIHRSKPFYESLVEFMSSGPCIVMVLEKDNAIDDLRKLMGATDPANADEGTIRKEFASSVEANVIHGSDSPESAATEIPYFFTSLQIQQ